MPLRLLLILVTGGAALVGATLWVLAGRGSGVTVAAVLRDPGGVREGVPVLLHGIEVGDVAHVERSDSGTVLTIRLRRDDVPLRADDRVAARRAGQGGEAVVIVPSAGASRRWRPGDVLQPAPAGVP
jgi:ABC-type transporter Mla subunit MlaD